MSPATGATATSTPAKARQASTPRRKRGEGQWALGYREPLNKNEENKKYDDGLNVRQRIIDIYAKRGFDSIDPADLRGRMRWYGLYTQRRPGIDGGKTAVLEPEELDDRYFMLRVRIDGGQLSAEQLRVISDISVQYARGTADVTDRQNIQLHWIEIESVPAIWEALEAVGLSTTEACGDTPAGHPRLPPGGPGRRRADRRDAGDRRHRRAVHRRPGAVQPAAQVQVLDQRLRRAVHAPRDQRHRLRRRPAPGDRRGRLRPVGRRRPVHQPDDRQAAGRVRPARAGARGLARRGRGLPRLRVPAAAAPGPDQVPHRRLGRGEVPRGAGEGVPRLLAARRPRPGQRGRRPARPRRRPPAERRPVLRRVRPAGRPAQRRAPAQHRHPRRPLRQRPGADHRRAEDGHPRRARGRRFAGLTAELDALGLPARPSVFRRHTMACTGIEFCKLAIVETKAPGDDPDRRARAAAARTSTRRSRSTSTAAPTPAPASRSPTSASRARWSPTPAASRSRASRSTSAARSPAVTRPGRGSGARSAASRPPPRNCPTTWSGCCAASTPPAPTGETFAAWTLRATDEELS